MRRIVSAVYALAIVSVALAVPADAAPKPIVLGTATPVTDAGGNAAFAVKNLPSGTAYLQWFNPATSKWERKASIRRAGSSGAVTFAGVPQGINRFRVQAGSRASNSVNVKGYGVYTYDEFNKTHTFGTATMAARDLYLASRDLRVPAGFGCDFVDMGLEMVSPQPTWAAEMAALSDTKPDPVIQIMQLPTEVPQASVTWAPVSGPIVIRLLASTSNGQQFFGWLGVQVRCLADPGI